MLELLLRHQLTDDGAVAALVCPVLVGQRVRPEHHRLVVLLARVAAVVLARLQAMHQDAGEPLLPAPCFRLARCSERAGSGDGDRQHLQEATSRWRYLVGGNRGRVRHRGV